jgi:hypothetical protein
VKLTLSRRPVSPERSKSRNSGPLGGSRSTPDDDDDAVMRFLRGETQKVVAVASQEHETALIRKPEYGFVESVFRESITQESDIVPELPEQIAQVLRHVVVEQESHSEAGAICLATSKSISPRWSS